MLGSDLVVIKDNRGFEAGFFWSDVHQFVGVYDAAEWVRVKFRTDHEGDYTLKMKMSMQEFLEQVEKQLNHPPRLYSDDKVVCEVPVSNESGDGV